MSDRNNETFLTAAECAARTGLTPKALRVYEAYGLITPSRTAGGWRCYGEADLIRLNTITLLKSAGLTLAQIRTVTSLSGADPSLQLVLEAQVDAWKAKRAEAERGQQIVEAALQNLSARQSLSIDELCNLVRNLAMSNPESSNADADSAGEITVDPAVLDRYVGLYRWGEFAVLTITREDDRLFSQVDGDPRHELIPESDTEFVARSVNGQVRFVTDASGRATSQIVHQFGIRVQLLRIDAETAAEIRKKLAERVASQAPLPGSEEALRRLLEGIESGGLDYSAISPLLSGVIEQQLPALQAMARYLGAVQAIQFRGVGTQGWDIFEVQREFGSGQWRILLNSRGNIENASMLGTDSKLYGLGFGRSGSSVEHVPTPGAEAALRRLIDGIRNGAPNYDEMSPLLAQSIRHQLPQMQMWGQRLGALVGVQYRETLVERHDVFEVQRENGAARWRICMGPDGTIASASGLLTSSGPAAGP